jgi:hypothetical protein
MYYSMGVTRLYDSGVLEALNSYMDAEAFNSGNIISAQIPTAAWSDLNYNSKWLGNTNISPRISNLMMG